MHTCNKSNTTGKVRYLICRECGFRRKGLIPGSTNGSDGVAHWKNRLVNQGQKRTTKTADLLAAIWPGFYYPLETPTTYDALTFLPAVVVVTLFNRVR